MLKSLHTHTHKFLIEDGRPIWGLSRFGRFKTAFWGFMSKPGMMKNSLILLFIFFANVLSAQRVEKELYNNFKVKYQYQVDNASGVKNGYFHSYATDGVLYESGTYKNGLKSGVWTTYGIMEGHPSEVSSSMEFANGKMNGHYVQYCWYQGKRYICGDYQYADDKEVTALKYHNNGKLYQRADHAKGIYEEWFEDGTPVKEKIGTRYYTYQKTQSGKKVEYLSIDTLDGVWKYHYFDNSPYNLRSFEMRDKNNNTLEYVDYNNFANGKPEYSVGNKKQKLDSTLFFNAYKYYEAAPRMNSTENNPYSYNKLTGDFSYTDFRKIVTIYHYYNDSVRAYSKRIDNTIEVYNKEDKEILDYFLDEKGLVRKKEDLIQKITTSYQNGIVQKEINKNLKEVKLFFENGKLDKHFGYAYDENKYERFLYEYYPSGQLKSKHEEDKKNRKFGPLAYYYDEQGNVVKIEEYNSAENVEKTHEGELALNTYSFNVEKKRFADNFFIQNRSWNGNGYWDYSYEYPKGENVYLRLDKLINIWNKEFEKSSSADQRSSVVKKTKDILDALLAKSTEALSELDLKLQKIKKPEEIQALILGIPAQ